MDDLLWCIGPAGPCVFRKSVAKTSRAEKSRTARWLDSISNKRLASSPYRKQPIGYPWVGSNAKVNPIRLQSIVLFRKAATHQERSQFVHAIDAGAAAAGAGRFGEG